MALSQALRRLDACEDASGSRLYAIERCSGARSYVIMSQDRAWDATCDGGPAHLYEVLSGPCNMYLDVEWVVAAAPDPLLERKCIDNIVLHVCSALRSSYGETNATVSMVSASGWKSSENYKCSWHIHISCSKVCWANSLAVGQFVRATCGDISEVDKVPYSGMGQNWRCVGSAKFSEPLRKFQPVDRDTFMACTIQHPVSGRALIYPDIAVSTELELPILPTILSLVESLHAGGTPRMVGADRCIVPFTERQFCEHAGRKHRSNHQYAVVNTTTLMWKMGCHACTDAIGEWRPFEDLAIVQRAFQEQCALLTKPPVGPPMRKVPGNQPGPAVQYDLRIVGPPRRSAVPTVCRDAIYYPSNE